MNAADATFSRIDSRKIEVFINLLRYVWDGAQISFAIDSVNDFVIIGC